MFNPALRRQLVAVMTSVDPASVMPPDDSGTSAFSRFCYQAHAAFPHCLDCALNGNVVSVVLEHIEDIAIEQSGSWRFIQIKTRNPDLGPWRLRHLLARDGALHSLLRSHRALPGVPATLEVHVEGALASNDGARLLKTEDGRRDPELHDKVRSALELAEEECNSFLDRVRLVSDLPSRDSVISQNLRLLATHAEHHSYEIIGSIYDRVVAKIYEAMAIQLYGHRWLDAVFQPASASDDARATLRQKQLLRQVLRALVAPITAPPRPLLRRLVDESPAPPSALEQKLLAGGANDDLVGLAKTLRANATLFELEDAYANIYDSEVILADVRERLRIRHVSLLAQHVDAARPAVQVWNALLSHLPAWAPTVDGNSLFRQDPDLLLGEICQMCDLCITDWGQADA